MPEKLIAICGLNLTRVERDAIIGTMTDDQIDHELLVMGWPFSDVAKVHLAVVTDLATNGHTELARLIIGVPP